MILPDTAEVKQLSDANPGSLLLWQADRERNVFAICFNKDEGSGETTKCMAALEAQDAGNPYPYLIRKNSVVVLDFEKDWFIDVEIGKEIPDLEGAKRGVLFRNGAKYFLRIVQDSSLGGGFVDLETGDFYSELPKVKDARWDDFSICIPQKHNRAPVQVFNWEKDGVQDSPNYGIITI